MATPHNTAEHGQIADVVLMPGDPLRAKYVADNFLEDVQQFNMVRNMFGFTGSYEGRSVSVMGSGMGIPSIGIYSWELFNHYDVDVIIRIGTAGGLGPDVQLRDVIIAQAACTDSNFACQFDLPGTYAPIGDFGLIRGAVEAAEELGVRARVGNIVSSDVFYCPEDWHQRWADMGCLAVEMESAGLYMNAAAAHKKALGIFTISDIPMRGESLPAEERQNSFTEMMEVALKLTTCI
ncbi:MAG: purine-nucleoside phosphorylase [Atopobiaceae bacterium]|nr:purine-nucleoside phosphorylase [Atopobiaceae bacterium]